MKWIEYQIKTKVSEIGRITDLLTVMGFDSFVLEDDMPLSYEDEKKMFTDIPADLPVSDRAVFKVYSTEEDVSYSTGSSIRDKELSDSFSREESEKVYEKLLSALKEEYKEEPDKLPTLTKEERDDSEWKDKYKETFKSFRVTDDIYISPMWEDDPKDLKETDTLVKINPGAGFGTGMHETTKLCLMNMEKVLKEDNKVFDIGCGSGILGISALLKGAGKSILIDIDELAIDNVCEDMELNNIKPGTYAAKKMDILSEKEEAKKFAKENDCEKFDIIFANILADVIIPLTAIIPEFIKTNGYYIVSGILNERSADVRDALEKNGFEIVNVETLGEWTGFLSRKL
ncbi:MAG: 50S ribosomal protein L11 methyltransferase [Lachnospiraceae bacterium]|nr:50S ribosomal protein L11 methyltransferase [Lachnospiraceae bacterium]